MDGSKLTEAFREIGRPPCEVHCCANLSICAKNAVCCESWRHWVATGQVIDPHKPWIRPGRKKIRPPSMEPDMTLEEAERGGHD